MIQLNNKNLDTLIQIVSKVLAAVEYHEERLSKLENQASSSGTSGTGSPKAS